MGSRVASENPSSAGVQDHRSTVRDAMATTTAMMAVHRHALAIST
ncbi:unannotated protein [freshwater metagenome]|uniref:Unannotated protein n=1 Tax=freshwater metagenome TaxID=449393 RepID=A0A6J7FAR1_9ZZZZ